MFRVGNFFFLSVLESVFYPLILQKLFRILFKRTIEDVDFWDWWEFWTLRIEDR